MAEQIAEQATRAAEQLQQNQQLRAKDAQEQLLLTNISVPDSIPDILRELGVVTVTQQYMEHVQVSHGHHSVACKWGRAISSMKLFTASL